MRSCITFTIALIALVMACQRRHKGDLDETCNNDGTCNAPTLYCGSSTTCQPQSAPPTDPRPCHWESDCFCVTCADKCGAAGIKQCLWSDTSTWGAKPAVCECK